MIGIEVNHRFFGKGKISAVSEDTVTVDFLKCGTKNLGFPCAFNDGHVVAMDPADQQKIDDYIRIFEEAKRKKLEDAEAARVAAEHDAAIRADFDPDYNVGYLSLQYRYTYAEVERRHGIQIHFAGHGINEVDDAVVLISSIDRQGGRYVYHDKWTIDGDYIYSGEGSKGDQTMTGGNAAIDNAENSEKKILLYVRLSPQEYYYQGIFKKVSKTTEAAPGADGKLRQEIKFRLKKVHP